MKMNNLFAEGFIFAIECFVEDGSKLHHPDKETFEERLQTLRMEFYNNVQEALEAEKNE